MVAVHNTIRVGRLHLAGDPVASTSLLEARHRCADELARLPPALATSEVDPAAPAFQVEISSRVRALADELDRARAAEPTASA